MAIHSRKNQYRGINAHLNSFLQATYGAWESFHHTHIVDIARTLRQKLPQGYYAHVEQSLQIQAYSTLAPTKTLKPKPDVTIFRQPHAQFATPTAHASPAIIKPVEDILDTLEEEYIGAVVIWQSTDSDLLGTPITRLELLSPTNKPWGSGYSDYRKKRRANLESGTPLIEIDYLHQSPTLAAGFPIYPLGEPGAVPFMVIVSDPRPSLKQGLSKIYGFGVDEPFPIIEIPLAGEETITYSLQDAYRQTFEENPFYQDYVDYSQLPLQVESYSSEDQVRIQQRMAAIQQAAQTE